MICKLPIYTVDCQFTQYVANSHSKLPIFRVKSVKIYTEQFFFTHSPSVVSVTNMRYGLSLVLFNLIDYNSQLGDLLGWKALLHIEGVSKGSQLLLGELPHLALPSRLDENQSLFDRSPT